MTIQLRILLLSLSLSPTISAARIDDPTMPPDYRAQQETVASPQRQSDSTDIAHPQWTVSSIMISPGYKIAIINGKQLRIGDDIAGAKVVEITYQHVTLRYQQKEFVISLRKSFISEISHRLP